MLRHGKALTEILAVMALAVETAILTDSLVISITALLVGLDVAFVLAVAWLRPAGSVEHHPALDKLFDDAEL